MGEPTMITKEQANDIKQLAYNCVLAVNNLRSATSIEEGLALEKKAKDAKEAFDTYLKEITYE
jgi:hypothetical protein